MNRIVLFLLPLFLVACLPSASNMSATESVPGKALATLPVDFSATKLYFLTAEAETEIANQPQNDATITAIMASKYAGGTAMAETMTAMPTLTLTPTIPPGSPSCRAQDLQAVYMGAMGATQSIVGGVNVTNLKGLPCFLQLWPQAVLVDASGDPLDIQYSYTEPSGLPFDANAMLGLPPGRTASFSLQWGNWCMPVMKTGASVRLTLSNDGGTLDIPTDLTGGGACNIPGNMSWVGIFPFSMP